ncbi:MAG: cell division protein FtsA [Bacteroidaceae bacterium]|nr:cell division protein FtsA [Bacteroidaceae bacterium]
MATTDFIAAIELSSSRISGMAGQKNVDGSINVMAYAYEDARLFIRKGLIFNIDKAKAALSSVIRQLEVQLGSSIAKVYVGIGGQSMRTVKNEINREVTGEDKISQTLIDQICDENRDYPIADMCILDFEPQEYNIDGKLVTEPVGVTGQHLTARFLNVVARATMRKNLEQSFEEAHVETADMFIIPRALSHSVLTVDELRAGCALVDFGAETTTVTVFKNNLMRYLAVIPLGGNAITKDLATLQIEEEEAERLKLDYVNFIPEDNEAEEKTITLTDGRAVPASQVCDIIESRVEEIMANVWNQIQLSGFEDKLLQGVVLTGGACKLPGLEDAFKKVSHIEKIRKALSAQQRLEGTTASINKDGNTNALIGLLCMGNENCRKPEPRPEPKVVVEHPETADMFAEDEDLKRQEEEARREIAKKEAEELRKRKEEEKRRQKEEAANKKPKRNWFSETFGKLSNELFAEDNMTDDTTK